MAIWSKEVFAKNLRKYMEMDGITQKDLAKVSGVSAPTVNDWLQAKKYPRIDKIEKLADYFKILKSDLIEEKTEKHFEMKKNNNTIADIVIRLRTDSDFLTFVTKIEKLDREQFQSVNQILTALLK